MVLHAVFLVLVFGSVSSKVLYFKPQTIKAPEEKPKFCNGLDCPSYTVISTNKDYEVRKYSASKWVTTDLAGVDYSQASNTEFHRLFDYISGQNKKGQKIAMTAPVIVRLIPGQGPACESNFTMSFYVSESMPAPLPSNPNVTLTELPELVAYVRSFGGFALKIDKWIEEATALAKAINDESKYHTDFYYTAGYDSPFKFLHRHNEVWFIAKQERNGFYQ